MATLTLEYSTGSITLADLNNKLALEFNYPATIPDPNNPGETIPNPETKAQWNHRHIGMKIKEMYKNQRDKALMAAAIEGLPEPPISFK